MMILVSTAFAALCGFALGVLVGVRFMGGVVGDAMRRRIDAGSLTSAGASEIVAAMYSRCPTDQPRRRG